HQGQRPDGTRGRRRQADHALLAPQRARRRFPPPRRHRAAATHTPTTHSRPCPPLTQPRRKKPTIQELAAQGVRDSLARPAGMPGRGVSALTKPAVSSKLQLDRSVGLLPLEHIQPDSNQPRTLSRENFNAEVIGQLVVAKLQMAAMSRANVPKAQRP